MFWVYTSDKYKHLQKPHEFRTDKSEVKKIKEKILSSFYWNTGKIPPVETVAQSRKAEVRDLKVPSAP